MPSPKEIVSTEVQRIANLAKEDPERSFTSLNHHLTMDLMREAYRRTRKDGATGVDQQTAEDFSKDLEANLQALLDGIKSGSYRAPAVRRVHIPKAGKPGVTRPIGVPTFSDKIGQRAVVTILEAIYEQDFLDCSYGFRPGRSAHQALQALWNGIMGMGGGFIVELDIKSFFDEMDFGHLRSFLRKRVRDGVLLRVIDKWLKAGVLENGQWRRTERGSPQGGVVSPLISNLYLHHVLDLWFEHEVRKRVGPAFLIRFADDAVLVFACEQDARRVS